MFRRRGNCFPLRREGGCLFIVVHDFSVHHAAFRLAGTVGRLFFGRGARHGAGCPGGLLGGFRRLVQGFQTGFQVFLASLDRRDVLLGDGFLETRYLVFYFTLEVCGQLVPYP